MNIKKLKIASRKIDQLDKKIFTLIKKRTVIVNYMLNLKQFKKQIVDKKRINQILKKIKKKSLINNLDPKITTKIWKSMILAYIDYQRKNFKNK